MERGFSPLDESLHLDASGYTRELRDLALDLGTHLPFAPAARLFHKATGATLSAATVRRWTESVGQMAVTLAEEENAQLRQTLPEPPMTTTPLVLETDGAMVPLLGGHWAEVKLLVRGQPVKQANGEVRLTALRYVARLADAETFTQHIHSACHHRGVETAPAVAAVQEGALWLQGVVDAYRPDAVRILDWPHASQRLTQIAEQVFGEGTVRSHAAAARRRMWVWEEGPRRLLAVLACWQAVCPRGSGNVAYLRDRQACLEYPQFRQAGWPVGSGAVEGGHRWVMQARLKGPGMHWKESNVNSMLALRELACTDQWGQQCPALLHAVRVRQLAQGRASQRQRHPVRPPASVLRVTPPPPSPRSPSPVGRSPLSHPWRRYGARLSATS